jgi:integrase
MTASWPARLRRCSRPFSFEILETRKRFRKLKFPKLRFHDLRGTHGTALLDAGEPAHVVAGRLGHDPAVLLKAYAKRTKTADTSAASVIEALAKGIL